MELIKIKHIQESRVKLRGVDSFSVEFEELKTSIEKNGFIGSLLVRKIGDNIYEIIDGNHRLKALKELVIDSVMCTVKDIPQEEAVYLSMVMNSHIIDTKPVEYAKHLLKALEIEKVTAKEIASRLAMSEEWLRKILSISKLDDFFIENLINEGKICLKNAYWLGRVMKIDRIHFIQPAMDLSTKDFKDLVTNAIRRKGATYRESLQENTEYIRIYAKFRGTDVCKEELSSKKFFRRLKEGGFITDIDSAYDMALKFCLSLDPLTREKRHYYKRKSV
jgi:ParB family chromosome partitioning protein